MPGYLSVVTSVSRSVSSVARPGPGGEWREGEGRRGESEEVDGRGSKEVRRK